MPGVSRRGWGVNTQGRKPPDGQDFGEPRSTAKDPGANSPMVEDLARAVRNGDWPAAYAFGEHLAVHVAAAAEATSSRSTPTPAPSDISTR